MSTQQITLDLPADILVTLNENEKELQSDIKLSFALKLFLLQKITIGKAAQIAGITRAQFENFLSENGFSISLINYDDVLKEINLLK